MVNDEQLGLGRVKLVQQFVDGEGGVGHGSDSTEPMHSPGGDGKLYVIGGEECNAVVIAYGLLDVGKTVSTNPDFFEVVTPACVVVDEPWVGVRTNSAIWGDKFLNNWLGGYEITG